MQLRRQEASFLFKDWAPNSEADHFPFLDALEDEAKPSFQKFSLKI